MSNEPRLLDEEEMKELTGATVQLIGLGVDALVFRTESGMLGIATICLGCGGHVGYYEIDAGALQLDPDISAS